MTSARLPEGVADFVVRRRPCSLCAGQVAAHCKRVVRSCSPAVTVIGGAQWVVYGLWFVLEVAIAATDLAEVIGSGTAIYLLSNGVVPLWAGVLITAVDVLLILMMGTRNFRSLELLVATFIALIAGIFACAAAWLTPFCA